MSCTQISLSPGPLSIALIAALPAFAPFETGHEEADGEVLLGAGADTVGALLLLRTFFVFVTVRQVPAVLPGGRRGKGGVTGLVDGVPPDVGQLEGIGEGFSLL